ncbi:MAG: hypothetical protein ACKPKO_43335 [Candidatus Fonsibacter sp.]
MRIRSPIISGLGSGPGVKSLHPDGTAKPLGDTAKSASLSPIPILLCALELASSPIALIRASNASLLSYY